MYSVVQYLEVVDNFTLLCYDVILYCLYYQIIAEADAAGGMTQYIESGRAKLRIEESATLKQGRIDSGKEVIVGVNKYRLVRTRKLAFRPLQNR
jgi:methylmalonyl-CoA mutase N-terminal domain/subunit